MFLTNPPHPDYSYTSIDEVFIYNTVFQYSVSSAFAEIYLFDMPITSNTRADKWDISLAWFEKYLKTKSVFYHRKNGSDHAVLATQDATEGYLKFYEYGFRNEIFHVDAHYNQFKCPLPRTEWHYPQLPINTNFTYRKHHEFDSLKICIFYGSINIHKYNDRTILANFMDSYKHPSMVCRIFQDRTTRVNEHDSPYLYYAACLVPHGDEPTSKRMFDSLACCCIPLLMHSDITFPYEELFFDISQVAIGVHEKNLPQFTKACVLLNNVRVSEYQEHISQMRRLNKLNPSGEMILGNEEWA